MEAVASGGNVQALSSGLRSREDRKATLDAELARLAQRAALQRVDWGTVRSQLEARVADWRGLLGANVSQARQLLRKLLVGPVRLTPTGPDQRVYRFEATVSLGKLLTGLLPTSVASLVIQSWNRIDRWLQGLRPLLATGVIRMERP